MIAQAAQAKRDRLTRVRIYLITDAAPQVRPIEHFLREAVAGGVGMVQLREKHMADAALLDVAARCSVVCRSLGVPFIVNDRVDIALASGADGVHLGQDDLPVASARRLGGDRLIVGLSTHSQAQIEAAEHEDVDYIGVGPIWATPTKEGRPPVGVSLVRCAAQRAAQPFFAIGGLEPDNVAEVVAAGGERVSVLRWITRAADPKHAARDLFERLEAARSARSAS
jgi:thiamine-phosphate pyrophosphorylase